MRDRTLFTKKHVEPFISYMKDLGFRKVDGTNEYEVLRFVGVHEGKVKTYSFYSSKKTEALTIAGEAGAIFLQYLDKIEKEYERRK